LQQILTVWSTLGNGRRMVVLGATIAMFAAIIALSRMAAQPSMSLLYAGLDPSAAGEVVAALEQQGVGYDVRAGAILVDSAQRDALRMTLAAEGLPASNGQGYELLDSLSGFGTTSQMFDAAYWRAKEGELARTITASPQIQAARVHISNQSSNPFQRDIKPTASVAVTTSNGSLSPAHAKALKFLVASAVTGLAPEDVAVIDGRSGTVMASDEPDASGSADDRAKEMKANIQRILEARVGPGNAVVEVSLETVTEREAIFERRFDPENRVAISSDTEERSTTSSGTHYEVSETTRELVRAPGAIKRLSVAVLIDGINTTDPNTGETIWTPRDEEELAALQELVASTVGFSEERGDTITLKTMEFEPLDFEIPEAQTSLLQSLNIDAMSLIQLAVLAVVSLALGLFVIRPILSGPGSNVPALGSPGSFSNGLDQSSPLPPNAVSSINPDASQTTNPGQALTGEIDDGPGPLPGATLVDADGVAVPADGQNAIGDDPVERLRGLIEERKDETIEVLRSWMEDSEENA